MAPMILLDGDSLTLDDLVAIAHQGAPVGLTPAARERVRAARRVVDDCAAGDTAVYGINTGFGSFAEVTIPTESLAALQVNLLRSHAAGVGEPLAVPFVRAMMALRANVLAKGYSGIRLETLNLLVELLNRGIVAAVPSRGSVGASGDLAPLAHLALVLIGEGDVWHGSAREPAAAALGRAGLVPVTLAPKEGLALINGTQASTAVLGVVLAGAGRLARALDIAAALSIDGLRGSTLPFDPRIHAARGLRGQAESAANLAILLEGSAINASHANCGRVQDAYSMRCAPQVHGAARDAIAFAGGVFAAEANAATDNPMVFVEAGEIVSGGNFHGAPVAMASDLLCIALAQMATISERRTERLVNPALSGLPAFLTRHGGLQSGLMLAQVTAAALASELKALAHPASVDTIPTSAGKEDHVSMSMTAGLKAARALDLAGHVVAIELLCACQAMDLLEPLSSSPPLMRARDRVRSRVARLEDDRSPAPDIAAIVEMIRSGDLERACGVKVN
jgi:histidine ammonia-lyase